MHDIVTESGRLQTITIHGKAIKLKYIIWADLKFTNIILGLGACSADYCCAWCKTRKQNFYKLDDDDDSETSRVIEEMQQLCTKKKSKKYENYNCVNKPSSSLSAYF